MAKRIINETIDDLTGEPNAQTLTFSLNGTFYEIDLTPKGATKLAKTLDPYIQAGRINRDMRQYHKVRTPRRPRDEN